MYLLHYAAMKYHAHLEVKNKRWNKVPGAFTPPFALQDRMLICKSGGSPTSPTFTKT